MLGVDGVDGGLGVVVAGGLRAAVPLSAVRRQVWPSVMAMIVPLRSVRQTGMPVSLLSVAALGWP